MNNVNNFKRALMRHYSTALQDIYDIDNPRTYKTICTKCNSRHSLKTTPTPCCSKLLIIDVIVLIILILLGPQ